MTAAGARPDAVRIVPAASGARRRGAVGLAAALLGLAACSPPTSEPFPAPRRYLCRETSEPPQIDGRLDDAVWDAARRSEPFVDIRGLDHPAPELDTHVRMLWDDRYLYVAAELEEPHLWAELEQRDAVVWHEDDFEVFLDPDGDRRRYFELEINARGTVFDLLLERTYRDGGPARHDWDFELSRFAVDRRGSLNDPGDRDTGWSTELAIAWEDLAEHAGVSLPPRPGDRWRVNFSRVDWPLEVVDGRYRKLEGRREHNWVWSPQGEIDMHLPERWGVLLFVDAQGRID